MAMEMTVTTSSKPLMFLLVGVLCEPALALAASCESLAGRVFDSGTIESAQVVPAGRFAAPPTRGNTSAMAIPVPEFCRVIGRIRPTINFEIWLPITRWNGKFQGVGGGGFAGTISYAALGAALREGYATASTDTGHSGGDTARWALGQPSLVIDFAHRAIHEVTVKAKRIVEDFYGTAPLRAYFVGCSRGGYQGLVEAARYPDDYDGIVAGAPAVFPSRYNAAQLWVARATLTAPAAFIPPAKYPAIHRAVLAACDARDGAKDGLLEDPRICDFDPQRLLCKGAESNECLTRAQVEAARNIYAPVRNPRTGDVLAPPLERGTELTWGALAGGPAPSQLAAEFFKYLVFEDPNWDWKTFDFDRDMDRAETKIGAVMATNPDLTAFAARGGKLIMYHGWADQRIAPGNSITYRNEVGRLLGEPRTNAFLRLYMVPGMQHCSGGVGPDSFDAVGALDRWVAQGMAPKEIIASRSTNGLVDRTRPLCPYPQVAVYRGAGSLDAATSFSCSVPKGKSP
jgi:feruloyl esterase